MMNFRHYLTLGLFGAVLCSCSSSGVSTGEYSADTVLASPFVSTVGTASATIKGARVFGATYAERREEIQDLLNATDVADCTFGVEAINEGLSNANCYGPTVDRTNTSGGLPTGWTSTSQLPGGDVGLWTESETDGTACAASQINSLVNSQAGQAHFANLVGASLYCRAKNTSSLGMPTDEATPTDVGAFTVTDGSKTVEVLTATITKISDADGNEGYKYVATGTLNDGVDTMTWKSVVQHISIAANEFKGRISYYIQNPTASSAGNCPGAGDKSKTFAGHQTYQKISASEVAISLDHGTFCGAAEPLDSDFMVNPGDRYDAGSNPDGWADGWNHVLFRFDPREDEATFMDGSYVYAWQAGFGDSHTRVFNASLASSGSDRTGTAYFGFGPTVQDGSSGNANRGKINGMICAWLEGAHTPVDYVQRQTLSLSSGKWVAASNDIKYAPTDACKYDPGVRTITYDASAGSYTNDVTSPPADEAATIDLLAVAAGDRDADGFFKSFATYPTGPSF